MLIRELIRRKINVGDLDVYHDPKALKRDHADALAQTLRGVVVSLAKEFTTHRDIREMKDLSIRRIEPIEKPTNDPPTMYQVGTWVADRLCALAWNKDRLRIFSYHPTGHVGLGSTNGTAIRRKTL